MSAADMLAKILKPSENEIREWLEGNVCRCIGYAGIVLAVRQAAGN